jgi:predicted Zn-dependent peptidase
VAPPAPNSPAALQQERAAAEQRRTVGLLGREQQRASAQELVDQLLYRGLSPSNINRFMTQQEALNFYSTHGEFLPPDIQRAMRRYAAGIR